MKPTSFLLLLFLAFSVFAQKMPNFPKKADINLGLIKDEHSQKDIENLLAQKLPQDTTPCAYVEFTYNFPDSFYKELNQQIADSLSFLNFPVKVPPKSHSTMVGPVCNTAEERVTFVKTIYKGSHINEQELANYRSCMLKNLLPQMKQMDLMHILFGDDDEQ